MTIVALDAMGGDYAPRALVEGALAAAADPGLEIMLVGRVTELRPLAPRLPANIQLVDAPDAVAMEEHPAASVRQKPHSSIMVALDLVQRGEAHAFASFGNTGAIMAASLLKLRRIPGVDRPALGALFQNARGSRTLLLDVGANIEPRPLYLCQFATMGKAYFERVLHHRNPSVGLLNVGEEENKGNQFTREAYDLLKRLEPSFIGNVEGKELVDGVADVVVTDGFSGNITVKISEGVAGLVRGELRRALRGRLHYRLAAWVLRSAFKTVRSRLDYERVGGAPLFGINGTVIVGHGRANAEAVASGLRLARTVGESGWVDAIREAFQDSARAGTGTDATSATGAAGERPPASRLSTGPPPQSRATGARIGGSS